MYAHIRTDMYIYAMICTYPEQYRAARARRMKPPPLRQVGTLGMEGACQVRSGFLEKLVSSYSVHESSPTYAKLDKAGDDCGDS